MTDDEIRLRITKRARERLKWWSMATSFQDAVWTACVTAQILCDHSVIEKGNYRNVMNYRCTTCGGTA